MGSGGGCLGGFRVLIDILVIFRQLCTGCGVRARVFGWFSGLNSTFGHFPTTVYWLWGPGEGVWVVFGS